jgi:hypothetical protein
MATKIIMRRRGSALVAEDQEAFEALASIPRDAEVMVEIRRPRNIRQHRLFRAMLSKVIEAGAQFHNADALLAWLKVALGRYDSVMGPSGQMFQIVHSSSFESMDQIEFRRFFEECADVICQHILPGVSEQDIAREVYEMLAPQGHS